MLAHRDEPWTVVIATQDQGAPRAVESIAARDQLRELGVSVDYLFLGHPEEQFTPSGGIDRPRLAAQLAALRVQPGERVYSHGSPGEYGHNGHKAVHTEVVDVLGGVAMLSAFSGGGEVVERIIDADLLAQKARVFNTAYRSQTGVWQRLARLMVEAVSEERHYALSALDSAAAGTTNPLRPYVPTPPVRPDAGALAVELNTLISRLRGAGSDVLIVGSGEHVDLGQVRASYPGRLDAVGPFDRGPPAGATVIAEDLLRWDPGAPSYDLVLCVGVLSSIHDFEAAVRRAARELRPGGQLVLAHEPLIQGHPDYGRAYFLADLPRYRRPTQAVLDLSRRLGLKLRQIKDLVAERRLGEPVITQLVRLERR